MSDYNLFSEYLEYRDDKLFWKKWPKSSRAKVGCEAGTLSPDGYRRVKLKGSLYLSHRVIWLLNNKQWPNNEVDHINGIRDDNSIDNLRDVSASENQKNRKIDSRNKSGVMGVTAHSGGKWQSIISGNGKREWKYFKSFNAAVLWRRIKEIEYNFHENHGRVV